MWPAMQGKGHKQIFGCVSRGSVTVVNLVMEYVEEGTLPLLLDYLKKMMYITLSLLTSYYNPIIPLPCDQTPHARRAVIPFFIRETGGPLSGSQFSMKEHKINHSHLCVVPHNMKSQSTRQGKSIKAATLEASFSQEKKRSCLRRNSNLQHPVY